MVKTVLIVSVVVVASVFVIGKHKIHFSSADVAADPLDFISPFPLVPRVVFLRNDFYIIILSTSNSKKIKMVEKCIHFKQAKSCLNFVSSMELSGLKKKP